MSYPKGKPRSEETKRKIGASLKGRPTWNKGGKMPEGFSKKISLLMMGNKYKLGKTHTDEYKKAVTERMKGHTFNRGKKRTEEQRLRQSVAETGKKRSLQTRINISNSLKGNKHPNWKGGITSENEKLRNSREYKEWRATIYIRDHFTCQMCGEVGGKLEAHHIKRWSDYPELRYDINNGVTLCVECHKLTDNYKRKANVKDNLHNRFGAVLSEWHLVPPGGDAQPRTGEARPWD